MAAICIVSDQRLRKSMLPSKGLELFDNHGPLHPTRPNDVSSGWRRAKRARKLLCV